MIPVEQTQAAPRGRWYTHLYLQVLSAIVLYAGRRIRHEQILSGEHSPEGAGHEPV